MDMLVAASIWTHPIVSTVLMLLGFGLVVFVHELGHFLVAKAVGIKVERFALGFGKKVWGFTRGETEYCLNVLPLGGYVKMLGQEDFALAEEAEQDPRAFNRRPVWARMAVVSAGVIMNVILAAVLFFIVFSVGKEYVPPVVGGTLPGYPAAEASTPADLEAGLQPGDVVMELNGDPVRKYDQLMLAGMLAGKEESFTFKIRRPGVDEPFEVSLTPAPGIGPTGRISPVFGIQRPISPVLLDDEDSREYLKQVTGGALTGGERVVSIAGEPIEHGWQLRQVSATLTGEPVEVVVTRPTPADGRSARQAVMIRPTLTWSDAFVGRRFRQAIEAEKEPPFKLPPINVLGLQPRVRVLSVTPASPAAEAGVRSGDVIVRYGQEIPTAGSLREINRKYRGKTLTLRVLREQPDGTDQTVDLKVDVPDDKQPIIGIQPGGLDQGHLVVAGVRPESPLAGANLVGSTITAVNGEPVHTWSDLIDQLTGIEAGQPVTVSYRSRLEGTGEVSIAPDAFAFDAKNYSYDIPLPFDVQMELRKSANPLAAFVYGVRETRDFIVLTYATLQGFFSGRVPGQAFTGPVGIFRAGIAIGERGPIYVVWLLAIISANLAVINFLPLPIVDGGHAVLLLIEKARGKPLSIKVQNIIQAAGLVLIVTLFVLLTYNDIVSWLRNS